MYCSYEPALFSLLQHIQQLTWGPNHVEAKPVLDNPTMRMSLPSMSTFITQSKPNFRITTVQDTLSTPFHGYQSGGQWSLLTPSHPQSQPPAASSKPPVHEKRASVIMKTSDVSKSVKSYWGKLPQSTIFASLKALLNLNMEQKSTLCCLLLMLSKLAKPMKMMTMGMMTMLMMVAMAVTR